MKLDSPEYSPDVELDESGRLVFARDIAKGEVVRVPLHMVAGDRRRGHELIDLVLFGKRKK